MNTGKRVMSLYWGMLSQIYGVIFVTGICGHGKTTICQKLLDRHHRVIFAGGLIKASAKDPSSPYQEECLGTQSGKFISLLTTIKLQHIAIMKLINDPLTSGPIIIEGTPRADPVEIADNWDLNKTVFVGFKKMHFEILWKRCANRNVCAACGGDFLDGSCIICAGTAPTTRQEDIVSMFKRYRREMYGMARVSSMLPLLKKVIMLNPYQKMKYNLNKLLKVIKQY